MFGSSDFKKMTPGAAKANNNENECGGDVTERVVAFRKPNSTLGKDDDDKDKDIYIL